MNRLRDEIARIATVDSTVLLQGESGTGKELVARLIHANSPRCARPFVALNCAAIPRELLEAEFFGYTKGSYTGAVRDGTGKFELANRGTLLLDEITELPPEAQSKLLRALEEREFYPVGGSKLISVDVRVIAATNRDLAQAVEEKKFREDLYYRLNVYAMTLPPLRDHREDVPALTMHYLTMFNRRLRRNIKDIPPAAMDVLVQHPWRGNVRELRNVVERLVLCAGGDTIEADQLTFLGGPAGGERTEVVRDMPESGIDLELDGLEKELVQRSLTLAQGNKAQAARLLKISPQNLNYRLTKYGIR